MASGVRLGVGYRIRSAGWESRCDALLAVKKKHLGSEANQNHRYHPIPIVVVLQIAKIIQILDKISNSLWGFAPNFRDIQRRDLSAARRDFFGIS